MKKRLSLLMVLMMIVSLLPMSAFAASTPAYTYLTPDASTTPVPVTVNYVFQNGTTIQNGQLRFELDGATFDPGSVEVAASSSAITTPGSSLSAASVNELDDSRFTVNVTPSVSPIVSGTTDMLTVKMNVIFEDEGEVNLRVIDNDNVGVNGQSFKLATVGTRDTSYLATTVKDAEKTISFDGGSVSEFEIKNIPATGNLVLELDKDLNWDVATQVIQLGGTTITAQPSAANINGNVLTLNVNALGTNGSLIVKPVLAGANRKASEGNIVVYMEAKDTNGKRVSNRATIGKLADYSVTMTVVEKNKKEIPNVWGGEEAEVTVTLKGPKGSFLARTIDFTVDGAEVLASNNGNVVTVKGSGNKVIAGLVNGEFKDGEFNVTSLADANATEVKFNLLIKTDADMDGTATITAAQRGWEVTSDLAKITPKFTAKADVTPIKKGEARNTSDLTLTEAKAGLLEKGDVIRLAFDTKRDYVEFTKKGLTVEATNGMKLGEPVWGKAVVGDKLDSTSPIKYVDVEGNVKYMIDIPVEKSSYGEAAVITIKGLNVSVDGSTTDDIVKLAVKLNKATVASVEYIKVVKEYELESILSVFTIGQTAYTVNGETKAAHSAPYIKEGRTMLPIRAVAESLGLEVQWNSATRTASFTDANKVAAVTIGSKVLYVNGTPMPLTVPAELTNDTTFVELRSLATAFGVQIDWDAAAKTATVSK